jgi:phosphoglucosamine mutase
VLKHEAQLGIALDGDADRCLLVDGQGREVDGDQILFIIARAQLAAGTLRGPVIGTQMSNLGLEHALRGLGVDFQRAKVGDRHVMELLKATGGNLGGETSGHTLCLDKTTTGDGIVTALQVLTAVIRDGRSLAELCSGMQKYPQALINVPVAGKAAAVLELDTIKAAEAASASRLGTRGRILLRPSGTEPLLRVMVESDDESLTRREADFLAAQVRAVCN